MNVGTKNIVTIALAVLAFIMIYFSIKSNAVSRIEELTVYRLLGIEKGSILQAYVLEMMMLCAYTVTAGGIDNKQYYKIYGTSAIASDKNDISVVGGSAADNHYFCNKHNTQHTSGKQDNIKTTCRTCGKGLMDMQRRKNKDKKKGNQKTWNKSRENNRKTQ